MENLTYSYIAGTRQIEIKPLSRIAELEKLAENLKATEPSVQETLEKLLASLSASADKIQDPRKTVVSAESAKEKEKVTYRDDALRMLEEANETDNKCPYAQDAILGALLSGIKPSPTEVDENLKTDTTALVISSDIKAIDAQFRVGADVQVRLSLSRPVKGVGKPVRLATRSVSLLPSKVEVEKVEEKKETVMHPEKKGCVIN